MERHEIQQGYVQMDEIKKHFKLDSEHFDTIDEDDKTLNDLHKQYGSLSQINNFHVEYMFTTIVYPSESSLVHILPIV